MSAKSRNGLPRVSVIVPVYNGESTLRSCLEAIFQSDYPHVEVIVVDDLSSDGSVAIAQEFACTIVPNGRNGGAADARNAGARASRGDILFFTDSDVMIQRDTIGKIVGHLLDHPECSAVFGSYTVWTKPTNFFSVYKNLVHHFTHQTGSDEASTFWAGCGAMWADAFFSLGGFNPEDTAGADVEDIALGYRLVRAGYRIRLAKDAQVTHTKYYSFVGLLKSDIFHRAVPWTKLMINERVLRNDLNTRWENFFSTLLVYAIIALMCLGVFSPAYLLPLPALVAAFIYLNRRLLELFLAQKGFVFLLKAIAMTKLFYVYCAIGSALGVFLALTERKPMAESAPSLRKAALLARRKP